MPTSAVSRKTLSIEDVAERLHISVATVRNWIKTGYLKGNADNSIDPASLAVFEETVAGVDKLNLRANKSQLDTHDHKKLQAGFTKKIRSTCATELDSAGSDYENSLSNSYRNREGIYYTPDSIVEDFFHYPVDISDTTTFLDPCCGSGNFLLKAAECGVHPGNLYGFDTDPVAVELCRTRIKKLTGHLPENIVCDDFLQHVIENKELPRFDIIYTNPPWGKKIPIDLKRALAKQISSCEQHRQSSKHSLDTASLFFYACSACVRNGGLVGFLMPDAFFNIAAFGDARKVLLNYELLQLTDYDKPFKSLLTGATGFIARKSSTVESNHTVTCRSNSKQHQRLQSSFSDNPKTIINHKLDTASAEVIQHLYSSPHVRLHGKATWALGVVTGNNKKHLYENPGKDLIPVHKGSDISPAGLSPAKHYMSNDFSQFQQVAAGDIYQAKEKIVYKFISNDLCFYRDTQQAVFLNSANMFVLEASFPLNHSQLTWLFNTALMNWLFRNLFNTHKVLRSDLESMPVFHEYMLGNANYTEAGLTRSLNLEKLPDGYRMANTLCKSAWQKSPLEKTGGKVR